MFLFVPSICNLIMIYKSKNVTLFLSIFIIYFQTFTNYI